MNGTNNKLAFTNERQQEDNKHDLTTLVYRNEIKNIKKELDLYKRKLLIEIESDIEQQIKRVIENIFKQ